MRWAGLVVWVALLALVPEVVGAELVYEFGWKSYSRISRDVNGEAASDEGEIEDSATLTMKRNARGEWEFSFRGSQGDGSGVLTPRGPERLVFPTAMKVGTPPAPPHLRGGSVTFEGGEECPEAFQLEYADGFLCRTMPAGCQHVLRWERRISGTATLKRGDWRC